MPHTGQSPVLVAGAALLPLDDEVDGAGAAFPDAEAVAEAVNAAVEDDEEDKDDKNEGTAGSLGSEGKEPAAPVDDHGAALVVEDDDGGGH